MRQGQVINAVAPTRICDVGGWTDTHFAGFGAVFNIAIYPYVEVQVRIVETPAEPARLLLATENFGTSYMIDPQNIVYDRNPLLEAVIKVMQVPAHLSLQVNVYSAAPPGASMGTSAAVSVALIGALDALGRQRRSPAEIATLAHAIETRELGLESGVQDQLASACGGIGFTEINPYPRATRKALEIPDELWWELEQRLMLAYIGLPHNSSKVHKTVIASLGADPARDERFFRLRDLAGQARDALLAGDLVRLGRVFNENTAAQRSLHRDLVSEKFEQIILVAAEFGALGCKVNGAGGDGGSIAILTDGDMAKKRKLEKELHAAGFQVLPIYLSRRGLRVWTSQQKETT